MCPSARTVCRCPGCLYGPCYPPSQWTGEDCGCNGQWVMFLLNGSDVALSRLSANTMTRQSDWNLDWQTPTHTVTYIPPRLWQALPGHHRSVLEGNRPEKQELGLLRPLGERYGRRTEKVPHTSLSLKGSASTLSAKVGFVIHHYCISSEDAAVRKVTPYSLNLAFCWWRP